MGVREEPQKRAHSTCCLRKWCLHSACDLVACSLETQTVWAGLVFLTVPVKVSATTLVSRRRQERFDPVLEGAGIGKSQRGTGDGSRALWPADGFASVKPQTSAFSSYGAFGQFCDTFPGVALGQLSRKHLGVVHEEQAPWPRYQTVLGAPWT